MPFVDMFDYKEACKKADKVVDKETLYAAICGVYEKWIKAKEEGIRFIFHEYFGTTLFDLGVDDLFEAKSYRVALAAYFQPRALRKKRELEHARKSTTSNKVEFASYNKVRVRVNESLSVEYVAPNHKRELRWRDVLESVRIWHVTGYLFKEELLYQARKQALAVMNDKRREM